MPTRIWQRRQIIWTQDTMYIARGEILVDTIPLHEIISVEEMQDDPETSRNPQTNHLKTSAPEKNPASSDTLPNRNQSEKDLLRKNTSKSSRQSILQVKTALDGFNFGRIYYVKPDIGTSGSNIVQSLLGAISIAKDIAERKSRFQKSQEKVRKVQESLGFQIMVAILIMLVSPPPPSLDPKPSVQLTPLRPPPHRTSC
jgi:hypothetical protein